MAIFSPSGDQETARPVPFKVAIILEAATSQTAVDRSPPVNNDLPSGDQPTEKTVLSLIRKVERLAPSAAFQRTAPWPVAPATILPSGDQATPLMGTPCSIVRRCLLAAVSQNVAKPLVPPVTTSFLPSGAQDNFEVKLL